MWSVEAWWEAGERAPLQLGADAREVFAVRMGEGPHTTLLHGFPSSSHDWAAVAELIAPQRTLLAPDLLGFGASEKPRGHDYTIVEQADLVLALWERDGVGETELVAHDYGVSVAQELLARETEGRLPVRLRRVQLLNGGLYPELHRPQPTQVALLDPEHGPKIGELIDGEVFAASLAPTFAPGFAGARAASEDIWRATARDDGQRISHLLIRYIPEREQHGARWVAALEGTQVPLAFIWGMLDPVSGAHMAERIRERLPRAPFLALDDVGHWPPIEAPDRVAAALLAAGGAP